MSQKSFGRLLLQAILFIKACTATGLSLVALRAGRIGSVERRCSNMPFHPWRWPRVYSAIEFSKRLTFQTQPGQKNIKRFLLCLLIFTWPTLRGQNCQALFSYNAQFEKVCFINHSTLANAHYYWYFGDGTSSNLSWPCHDYADNGTYEVCLYVLDTISKCSAYYQQWLQITKFSTDPCSPLINDSVYFKNDNTKYYIKIQNLSSSNCSIYYAGYGIGGSGGNSQWFALGAYPINYISSLAYSTGTLVNRRAFKTTANLFTPAENYGPCSANFEFSVVSENQFSQKIFFTAMNRSASFYQWTFVGFGNPINVYSDTASMYFNGLQYENSWLVFLKVKGQSGCSDSLSQEITIRKKSATYVGLNERIDKELNVQLRPNPVKDKLSLAYEPQEQIERVNIQTPLGQLLFSEAPVAGQGSMEIDLTLLPPGIYYLEAQNRLGRKIFKVLKE